MKPGDAVRWAFVQGDGQRKFRPAIVLGEVPPYKDWLVCAVSAQGQREVKGLDLLIDEQHADFEPMGLRTSSLIRVAQLTTLPDKAIQGAVGQISPPTLELLKARLREWLK